MPESIDREFEAAFAEESPARGPGKVLLVSTDESVVAVVRAALKKLGHACTLTSSIDAARTAVARTRFDLALVSGHIGEGANAGNGAALLEELAQLSPGTSAVMLLATPSFDDSVLAMRAGAIDVLVMPMDEIEFASRIESALLRSRANQVHEERVARLTRICRRLNTAREEISDQVELLCKELVAAYEESNSQLCEVAMTTEFRTLLRQELDLEELLRSALEYLLTKTGPTNAAVFLPDEDREWSLGAYVNYDCPRESIGPLLDKLGDAVCPQLADESEIVRFVDASEFAAWSGADVEVLVDSQVIALACRHEKKCMAIIVLFRKDAQPFAESLAGKLDLLRPIFAAQLNQIIRVHHRLHASWPKQAVDEECDFHDDDPPESENFGFGGWAA